MGSLEDERLVQMVHDFIESGSSPPIFPSSSNCLSIKHQTQYLTLQDILSSMTEAESRVLQCVLKHMRSKRDSDKTTTGLKKWLVLKLKTDGFNASICQNSWATSLGCPAGDYEYIDIIARNGDEKGDKMRLILDTDFRSQFELARPTPTYKNLTDTLPSVFVGSEDKLNKIICLLCSAAKQSLIERGLHVPPWRTSSYMQSKWLSGYCKTSGDGDGDGGEVSYSREIREANSSKNGAAVVHGYNMWAPPPPLVKPKKRRDLGGGGGSALSSQFSGMGVNCC